ISFDTNFKVDSTDLNDKVVLEKVELDGAGTETGTVPLETTTSLSASNTKVTITPAQELDYLTKYRVTVFGGPDGITCTITSPLINPGPGGCLRDTYVWEFTTALPRVHSFTPTVSNPNSPTVPV